MKAWKTLLKADSLAWLLERDNPAVQYFSLTGLLDKPEIEPDVRDARHRLMTTGLIPAILAKQNEDGSWGIPQDFYIRSKYRGTVWQIITLAELGADGSDNRIRHAGEFILHNSQDRQSGGFAYLSGKDGGGDHSKIVPCLTGNMVWSLIRFGFLDDPRVQQGIGWITRYQRFDDSDDSAPAGWPYDRYQKCYGKHTCHMGVVKVLKALAEIPAEKRDKTITDTIARGSEYLLKHRLFKRSHDTSQIAKPAWLEFGFPRLWNTDALEMLFLLTRLGSRDPRLQDAIDLVVSRQDESGRWRLETTYNGRSLLRIERQNEPSKWVTLHALTTLKRLETPSPATI